MSRTSYYTRATLYFLCAALPILDAGIMAKQAALHVTLGALGAGLIALRAFIDTSPSKFHEAEKENENG